MASYQGRFPETHKWSALPAGNHFKGSPIDPKLNGGSHGAQ